MKKNILLISLAIIFLGVLCYDYVTDYSSLATDSGFDTSYSSESSGSSSSDSDYDRPSYSYQSDNSNNRTDYVNLNPKQARLFALWMTFFLFSIIYLWILFLKESWAKKKKYLLRPLPFLGVWILCSLVIPHMISLVVALILTIIIFLVYAIKKQKIMTNQTKPSKEEQALIDECYKIFYDVQMAWMNFDYDKMRELVTDELFNQYQNQLKQLEIVGEKNIMKGFRYLNGEIIRNRKTNGKRIISLIMKVKFYDYIINQEGKIVRGKDKFRVKMTYKLNFIADEGATNICPNCGSHLTDSMSKCPHCNTIIHGTRKALKLSSKKVIDQL